MSSIITVTQRATITIDIKITHTRSGRITIILIKISINNKEDFIINIKEVTHL